MKKLEAHEVAAQLRALPQWTLDNRGGAITRQFVLPDFMQAYAFMTQIAIAAPTAVPQRPDWTVDQDWASYTTRQHAVGKTLYERQTRRRVCAFMGRVMRTHYRIDDFQESYFVLDGLQDLLALANTEFAPYYERLNEGPSYQPGDVLATDTVVHRGNGSYHRR